MTSLLSERVARMKGYVPGEQPRAGTLLKLNTNENPYPPSPRVLRAVGEAASRDLRLYPSARADELREAAAQCYGCRPEQVLAANGSDEILALCLRACVSEGDVVAFPRPTYSLYPTLAEAAGASIVEVPALPGEIPAGLLEAGAAVTFLCSPNSPSGASLQLQEISRFAQAAGGLVVVDEAYVDFASHSALEILDRHSNLLVSRSFSKSFSMAGVRLGLGFAAPDLIEGLNRVKDSYNVSRLAAAAGVAALADYRWMRDSAAKVCATRDRTISRLRQAGWQAADSDANFFWLDCGGEGGLSVYRRLRDGGVLVRYFNTEELRGGVRVSVGTDEQMERFLAVLGV